MLTPEKIEELRGLLAKATPGPWRLRLTDLERPDYAEIDGDRHGALATVVYRMEDDKRFGKNSPENEANAALIVAAINALPSLLARIEALTVERDQWQSRAQTAWDQMDADMRRSIETAIAALEPSK